MRGKKRGRQKGGKKRKKKGAEGERKELIRPPAREDPEVENSVI